MELALDGIPVDESETEPEGELRISKLSDPTLKAVFKEVGALPDAVTRPEERTQKAEVQRVHDKLASEINGMADPAAKRKKLTAALLPLATTLADRKTIADRIANTKDADLMAPDGPLEQAFNLVLQNRNAQGQERGPDVRKQAIAHLLFNIDTADEARKRAAAVIGLKAFAAEADRQALALKGMADQIRLALVDDRGRFKKEYLQVFGDIQLLATDLADRQHDLARQQALVESHKTLLNARLSDAKALQGQLEVARQETSKALEGLGKEQRKLFEIQQKVGMAEDKNLQLEREIRGLERSNP
jgi:hypothetical protein